MSPDINIVRDYRGLISALRARRKELGITQFELDQIAGLQDGYTGKIESWENPSGRGIGPLVLPLLLGALGLELVVRPVPGAFSPNPAITKLPRENHGLRYLRVAPARDLEA